MNQPIYWLNEDPRSFPKHEYALIEPNGLLAAGGDLSPERLLNAYSLGIFPWYNEEEPILWWSPDPRSVVIPSEFTPSRSLKKEIKREKFQVTSDTCFTEVMMGCAEPREDGLGTWINERMINSYTQLNQLGYAHSIECWQNNQLIGGLYGVCIGQAFFGESMFSRASNASKIAFAALCEYLANNGFKIIDCQVHNPHLERLGAKEISRDEFLTILRSAVTQSPKQEWSFG